MAYAWREFRNRYRPILGQKVKCDDMEMINAVLIGVVIFILSQYFLKLVLEPAINFRKLLSDISFTLLYNQAKIAEAVADDKELPFRISMLSAQLRSTASLIPAYSFWSLIKILGLPKRENILKACHELNLLSFGVKALGKDQDKQASKNDKSLEKIAELLDIETTYIERGENPHKVRCVVAGKQRH